MSEEQSRSELSISLYASLLPLLVKILELTQAEDAGSAQARMTLWNATREFKAALSAARQNAVNLPGGDMSVGEQDEVIQMLEEMKGRKREQLEEFSSVGQASPMSRSSDLG